MTIREAIKLKSLDLVTWVNPYGDGGPDIPAVFIRMAPSGTRAIIEIAMASDRIQIRRTAVAPGELASGLESVHVCAECA